VSGDVSVIIPCYNQWEYIRDAIISARDQTVSAKEIIVVDDGSRQSENLDYRTIVFGAYIHPFHLKGVVQSNRGLPGARNTGIMNASGEFILPLDADDILRLDYIEKTLPLMDDPAVGVVYTAMQTFEGEVRYPQAPVILDLLKHHNQLFYCCLIRKTALLECGGYNTRMTLGYEDWNLWIDLLKRGWEFAYVPEPLFFYRERPGTMIEESDKHRSEIIEQIKRNHPELY